MTSKEMDRENKLKENMNTTDIQFEETKDIMHEHNSQVMTFSSSLVIIS